MKPARRNRSVNEPPHLEFTDVSLEGADFSGKHVTYLRASNSRFVSCRFDGMRVGDARFASGDATSEYVDCSFNGARIRAPTPGPSRFLRCSFRDTVLEEWYCRSAEFVECVFSGLLRKSYFMATVPEPAMAAGRTKNTFRGNDFSGADLRDVAFRSGIKLKDQKLPSGPDYIYIPDVGDRIKQVRLAVASWPSTERPDAEALLDSFEFESSGGQQDLFLRRSEYNEWRTADQVLKLLHAAT